MTAKAGKNDLLHPQYVVNNYFDAVELKGPRAPIILTKENNCSQPIGGVEVIFALVCGRFSSHSFWLGRHAFHGGLFRATAVPRYVDTQERPPLEPRYPRG